jgi:hypothetical protein
LAPAETRRADAEEHEKGIPGKVVRYANRLVKKHDRDGDNQLQSGEWTQMHGDPRTADLDGNGSITPEELAEHVAAYGRYRRIRPPRPVFKAIDFPPLLIPEDQLDSPEAGPDEALPSDADAATDEEDPTTDQPLSEADRRELQFFVPSARLPKGLPAWFIRRDADGDGQLTMSEFAPKATRTQLAQFTRYDANRDGVITAAEYLHGGEPAAKEVPPQPQP